MFRRIGQWIDELLLPKWPELSIKPLLAEQWPTLDQLFGPGAYTLTAASRDVVHLVSDKATGTFWYDYRDGYVDSMWSPGRIDPLTKEDNLHGSSQWCEFLGIENPQRDRRPISSAQVARELEFATPVLALFENRKETMAALRHIEKRNCEYNDWAAGRANDYQEFRPPDVI